MNTGMKTDTDRDTDTGVGTARGAGAKQRQPQGEQRADEHANTAEGNTVEGNASSKKEMDTDKARDEARASNTITTISDKTTQKTATSPDMTWFPKSLAPWCARLPACISQPCVCALGLRKLGLF